MGVVIVRHDDIKSGVWGTGSVENYMLPWLNTLGYNVI